MWVNNSDEHYIGWYNFFNNKFPTFYIDVGNMKEMINQENRLPKKKMHILHQYLDMLGPADLQSLQKHTSRHLRMVKEEEESSDLK